MSMRRRKSTKFEGIRIMAIATSIPKISLQILQTKSIPGSSGHEGHDRIDVEECMTMFNATRFRATKEQSI